MMAKSGDANVVAVTEIENGFAISSVEDCAVDGYFDGAERETGERGQH
jgi:hypothetical protein